MKKMDASAQEALRMRVVNAVAEGMSQSEAARTFKVGVRSVNRWMRRVAKAGARSVAAKRRGRQPGEAGKLTARQAQRIERLIIGKLPDQLHRVLSAGVRSGRRHGLRQAGAAFEPR